MNILRQINLMLASGDLDEASMVQIPAWKGQDVQPKYILVVGSGDQTAGYASLDGSTSHTIPLPEGYSSANRLAVALKAYGQVRVTIASPAHANSVFTLNGSTTVGAPVVYNGRVTSITVTTPSSTDVKVAYFLFELPDLTDRDSFRGGVYNFGSIA